MPLDMSLRINRFHIHGLLALMALLARGNIRAMIREWQCSRDLGPGNQITSVAKAACTLEQFGVQDHKAHKAACLREVVTTRHGWVLRGLEVRILGTQLELVFLRRLAKPLHPCFST